MRTIFEVGDKVKITQDWRNWKKNERATIKRAVISQTPMHLDSYTLTPENGEEKDFYTLQPYMIEYDG